MTSFRPPRSYKKNEMLYPDRCMLKYHGFLLSDHDEAMREDREESFGYRDHWDQWIKESLRYDRPLRIRTEDDCFVARILSVQQDSFLIKENASLHQIRREAIVHLEPLGDISAEGFDDVGLFDFSPCQTSDQDQNQPQDHDTAQQWDPWNIDRFSTYANTELFVEDPDEKGRDGQAIDQGFY